MGEEISRPWHFLARCYLDLQHLRMACEARLRKLREKSNVPEFVMKILNDYHDALEAEEKRFLKELTPKIKSHPLWDWCERVKGMGPVTALMFLGYIDPYKADTAGKARAYAGLAPGREFKSGSKVKFNPEFKGRAWLIAHNVIIAKDPYYYKLYQEKKNYYLTTARKVWLNGKWVEWPPFQKIMEDPKLCPKYEECRKRLVGRAERLNREPKALPCRAHVNNMAIRWLAGLLVSHATELMREAEGLSTENFKRHHGYIPPKP